MAENVSLIGRTTELDLLRRLVLDGRGGGAVVVGAAGVGKSRLARECLLEAARAGLHTEQVTGTVAGAGVPFGALAGLLPASGDVPPVGDRTGFFQRCRAGILGRSRGRRMVVLVDDLHLLDDDSAGLIHLLAQTDGATVLATLRSGAAVGDSVVALWKDGLLQRLELAPLAIQAVEVLLAAVLGGPVDRAAATRIDARCRGNALFLRELAVGARDTGALREVDGCWRLVHELTPSARLRDLIEQRLASLDGAARGLMEVLAVGEPLGVAELAGSVPTAALDALERARLVHTYLDGRRLLARLGHPLYGDVLREQMPPPRLQSLGRALADTIDGFGARRRDDLLRSVTWRPDGDIEPGRAYEAAVHARRIWALPLAQRLAESAVAAGGGFDAELLLGELTALQGRHADAEARFAALVPAAAGDAQRAALAGVRMDNLVLGLGRIPDALAVAAAAEAATADGEARDALAVKRSHLVLIAGDSGTSLDIAEPLLERARGVTLVLACMTSAHGLAVAGRTAAAVRATRRGEEVHAGVEGLPPTLGAHIHLGQRCAALGYAGALAEAIAEETAAHHAAVASGSAEAQALHAWGLARSYLTAGQLEAAARYAGESAHVYRATGSPQWLRWPLITLAHALALQGRAGPSREALDELDGLGIPAEAVWGAELLRARAWSAVAAGDLPGGTALLHAAVALADRHREPVFACMALHDLARLGHAPAVHVRLAERADGVEGPLPAAAAAHAAALAAAHLDGVESAARAFETVGARLLAAEAAARAAALARAGGDQRRAAANSRRARSLAAGCGGARTPALADLAAPVPLSPVEHEVARLAAGGRSNAEIADALGLARKTVENHLLRVFAKLGLSARSEIAGALEADPR